MRTILLLALVFTLLWAVGALGIGFLWMDKEYKLIVNDNGDGTVTFRDGPYLDTSTKTEFLFVALKNSLIVVLLFPTLPYILVMGVLTVVGLVIWLGQRSSTSGGGAIGQGHPDHAREG